MMRMFNCLDKNVNIFGNHFLEASAGTGKTFAVEHLVVRLILESMDNTPISIEEILVVTFTKAATRELKHRIRYRLEKAKQELKKALSIEDISPFYDYLTPFLARKKEAIKVLQEAIYLFDQAQIFTIHGFCFSMLSQYAYEAQTIFNISEDTSYKDIIKEVALDYLRYLLNSFDYRHNSSPRLSDNDVAIRIEQRNSETMGAEFFTALFYSIVIVTPSTSRILTVSCSVTAA